MSDRRDRAKMVTDAYRNPWSQQESSIERQDVLATVIVIITFIAVDILTPLGWIN